MDRRLNNYINPFLKERRKITGVVIHNLLFARF